ncbi:solute carrier organic anion transporter family member 4C1-like [Ptychodera flava]|uniref:solute carrier organic anion transporter family member 4C1-like n=1 Tax=Ptychodera flava TaxID=63121 RepID=UPI00396A9355
MKEPESENAISDENETSNFPEKTDSTDQTNSNAVSQSEDKMSVTKTDKITRWGWFSYRPNWLQVFNKPTWLCSSVGSLYFTQAMVMWGFLFISISSIETRFNLSSTAVGVIIASYDIFSAIFVLFVAYYSNYGSKSRILAVGCFGMGLGSFIFMLPHFTSGPYMYSETNITQTVCNPMINATDHCEGDDWQPSSLSYYFIVFIIAQFFHGVGGTPVYTVSPVYMDENASDKRSATYIGIIYACSCIGPAVGFILGGYFLTIYTDIRYADSVNITPEHPAWVGAWWLGFLIGWLLAWLVAVPLSGFPGELPAKEEMRSKRTVQTHESKSQAKASQPGFGTSFRDFPASFWLLCKNPAYICTTLGASAALLIVVGFAAFLPKFIENQFHQTSGTAAVLLGVTFVPGAAGGTYLGGWIVKRLELKVRGMILLIIVMTIAVMVMALMFMIKCPEEQLAGVFVPYEPNRTEVSEVNLVSPCNEDCGCIMDIYSPVCGANGLQYFDSCYAGCTHFDEEQEVK